VRYESNVLLNYVLDVMFELQNYEYAQMTHTDKYMNISTTDTLHYIGSKCLPFLWCFNCTIYTFYDCENISL